MVCGSSFPSSSPSQSVIHSSYIPLCVYVCVKGLILNLHAPSLHSLNTGFDASLSNFDTLSLVSFCFFIPSHLVSILLFYSGSFGDPLYIVLVPVPPIDLQQRVSSFDPFVIHFCYSHIFTPLAEPTQYTIRKICSQSPPLTNTTTHSFAGSARAVLDLNRPALTNSRPSWPFR